MKKILFLSLIISLIIVSCTQQQQVVKSPLDGAWDLISYEVRHGDTIIMKLGKDFTGTEMKIWSGKYFNYVGQYKRADSTMNNYGGGTFTLVKNRYDEIKTYPTLGTVKLLLEIKNDTITQTWPVDDNGQVNKNEYYIQKLKRKQ
jgi:hypothetical protein